MDAGWVAILIVVGLDGALGVSAMPFDTLQECQAVLYQVELENRGENGHPPRLVPGMRTGSECIFLESPFGEPKVVEEDAP